MKKYTLLTVAAAFGLLSIVTLGAMRQTAHAQEKTLTPAVLPAVFQAAGPNVASIQSSVDAFRAALGEPNNGNTPGPLAIGRREINWDGGGNNDATTAPVTPFNVFLNIRGGQFTTPGQGLSQAPPSGGPQGGLVGLFNNQSYGTEFSTFSPLRLFTPVGSNITNAVFFIPGSNGGVKATVRGFGVVFSDVDQPTTRAASTQMDFFSSTGELLFSSSVPASPGVRSVSFLGIVFNDARIASVRIKTGDVPPGPDDDATNDIVMMDDFIYGEPQVNP